MPGGSRQNRQCRFAENTCVVKLSYSPFDSLTLSAKWFRTELISESPTGSDPMMNRVQVDAVLKF